MFSTSVKVKVQLDHHDLPLEMKAILVNDGMLMSHLKYLIKNKLEGRKDGWITKSIQAVRYLIDYTIINKEHFSNPHDLFMGFSRRINSGTISRDGSDPSMLRWWPRSTNSANEMITHVVAYSDWLCEQTDDIRSLVNPKRDASKSEILVNLAAYNQRMNQSFLKHTYSKNQEDAAVKYVRSLKNKVAISTFKDPKKPFDEDKIWLLLGTGFKRRGVSPNADTHEKYNLGNILITMLLHFGGLRACEPFHMYKDDIIPNEGLEQIRVYHPTEGLAPRWYRNQTKQPNCNRSLFLLQKYELNDRRSAREGTAYHAGWKNPPVKDTGKYFPVFLFGEPGVRELFYKLFTLYIHTRTEPLPGREHPFLFTNGNGDPLSMGDFEEAHKNAMIKLGMSPYLEDGGARHSHRHSYGQRLAELKDKGIGIDELIIAGAMHHKSLKSQEVYTDPHTQRIVQQLAKAVELTTTFMPVGMLDNF
jgi:integrase